MHTFINAFLPIVALILIGYTCKAIDWMPEGFWANAEKLAYHLLFPALLIGTLATPGQSDVPLAPVLFVVLGALGLTSLTLLLCLHYSPYSGAEKTSIVQATIRFNTFIGLGLGSTLYGEAVVPVMVLAIGAKVTLINILCVSAFAFYIQSPGRLATKIGKEVLRNPLIMSCVFGLSLRYSGIALPEAISNTLAVIAQAALPLGVMAVGAALARNPSAVPPWGPLLLSSGLRFVLLAGSASVLSRMTALSATESQAIMLLFLAPTAASGYVLAKKLGGDASLMAGLIAWQTLLGALLLPAAYALGLL